MECYECLQSGVTRETVGLCHHCSAALCADHIVVVEEPLMIKRLLAPVTIPPKRARLFLCSTCNEALEQLQAEPATLADICR
jgi:hypothetical protein